MGLGYKSQQCYPRKGRGRAVQLHAWARWGGTCFAWVPGVQTTEQLSPAGQVQTGLHPLSPGLAGLLSPPTSSLEGPAKRGPQGFKPRAAVGPTWSSTCSQEDRGRAQNCSGLSCGPLSCSHPQHLSQAPLRAKYKCLLGLWRGYMELLTSTWAGTRFQASLGIPKAARTCHHVRMNSAACPNPGHVPMPACLSRPWALLSSRQKAKVILIFKQASLSGSPVMAEMARPLLFLLAFNAV